MKCFICKIPKPGDVISWLSMRLTSFYTKRWVSLNIYSVLHQKSLFFRFSIRVSIAFSTNLDLLFFVDNEVNIACIIEIFIKFLKWSPIVELLFLFYINDIIFSSLPIHSFRRSHVVDTLSSLTDDVFCSNPKQLCMGHYCFIFEIR